LTTPVTLEIIPVAGGEPRVLLSARDPQTELAPLNPYLCAWSAEGRAVYFVGRDPREGSTGIWRVAAAGGRPRLAVRFDNPALAPRPSGIFEVHSGRFHFTLIDLQSDVWMTEIVAR
jgi:hypothetical protein